MKLKSKQELPWKVEFRLAYDGGGSEFARYYRTRIGAKISIFLNVNIASWGGEAKLMPNEEFVK